MRHAGRLALIAGIATIVFTAERAPALFHAAVIDEVMTSYGGDANVQFIEVRTLAGRHVGISDRERGDAGLHDAGRRSTERRRHGLLRRWRWPLAEEPAGLG